MLPVGGNSEDQPGDGLRAGLRALAGTLTDQHCGTVAVSGRCDKTMAAADLLAMSLDRFVREGQLVEVRVPWLEITLWFVPEERDAEMLGREGVKRGRVWTARELLAVMTLPARTPATVRTLALAKVELDSDLVDVQPKKATDADGPAGVQAGSS